MPYLRKNCTRNVKYHSIFSNPSGIFPATHFRIRRYSPSIKTRDALSKSHMCDSRSFVCAGSERGGGEVHVAPHHFSSLSRKYYNAYQNGKRTQTSSRLARHARIRRVSHTCPAKRRHSSADVCAPLDNTESRGEQKRPVRERMNGRASERTRERTNGGCTILPSSACSFPRFLSGAIFARLRSGSQCPLPLSPLPEVRQLVASQFRITALTISACDSKSSDSLETANKNTSHISLVSELLRRSNYSRFSIVIKIITALDDSRDENCRVSDSSSRNISMIK